MSVLCFLFTAVPGLAIDVRYGLTPAMVIQSFKPGQAFELDLSVSNGSASPVLMRGTTMDFWFDERNEKVFAAPGTMPRSASNWVEFVPRVFTVPAQGSEKVKMIVTPPAGVSGSYYTIAFVESKPELTSSPTVERKAVFTNVRLGALLMLAAEKTEVYQVEISDAKFSPPAPNHDLTVDCQFFNRSNTHVFPRPELALLNAHHELVAKAQGDIKRFLPQQKDRISVSWGGTLPPGSYTAVLTLVYADDNIQTREFPFQVAAKDTLR